MTKLWKNGGRALTNYFVTSDTHFGHRGIITHSQRPFANIDEMDEFLVKQWNDRVGPNDVIWHLGDFSFRKQGETLGLLYRLDGRKHLIKGNHDRLSQEVKKCFHSVLEYSEQKINPDGEKIVLCHYPFDTWNKSHYGRWHLHGHSHGSLTTRRAYRLDVGVDARPQRDYAPWAWDELIDHMSREKLTKPVDHHTPRKR